MISKAETYCDDLNYHAVVSITLICSVEEDETYAEDYIVR